MTTAFFSDERCFWHGGGNYALTAPVGGLVQPLVAGGLPEAPETKRRLLNLLAVTGLLDRLDRRTAPPATRAMLERVHPAGYLDRFAALSAKGGGELGPRAPFGPGGYDIAALSAGLAAGALEAVLRGRARNAYALTRPPGHHALPDLPNGFCLLNNIAVAIRAAQAAGLVRRVAVLDWDVHHGNGTEAVFRDDPEVLTISIHQDRNYPVDTGAFDPSDRGNLNIPLPPGTGHRGWLAAVERLAVPAIRAHEPEAIVIACGYDASAFDPLGRMLATAGTFRAMTEAVMAAAEDLCGGRLAMMHEGGYSEVHVPFCGHAVLDQMAGAGIAAPDPFAEVLAARQPDAAFDAFVSGRIAAMAEALRG